MVDDAPVEGDDFSYQPPLPGAAEEAFLAWADALPMSRALGIVCTSLSTESGAFSVGRVPLEPNPNGAVHGGVVAAIADQCLGVVAVANAPREQMSVTASLHGQFHRPAIPPLAIRVRRLAAGARLIFVECQIDDARGKRCGTFQATMAVGGAERRSPDARGSAPKCTTHP
jgi:uncharacterized protein (TIGR00369 family)